MKMDPRKEQTQIKAFGLTASGTTKADAMANWFQQANDVIRAGSSKAPQVKP
jgi:hypothetical protein